MKRAYIFEPPGIVKDGQEMLRSWRVTFPPLFLNELRTEWRYYRVYGFIEGLLSLNGGVVLT